MAIPVDAPFGVCPDCAAGEMFGFIDNDDTQCDAVAADERIPGFTIVRELGEGGFGLVYLARQESPVRRQVALKVLKPGIDSAQILARFDAEKQVLARMDHPNVAQVFDGGETVDGMPYFAMEYVDGFDLRTFCEEQKLDMRGRLALFTEVCRGVHHAHQKGIVHRDLKPSNVMVMLEDGQPLAKVIDFGIAKALAHEADGADGADGAAMETRPNQMLGTLPYMSPEQLTESGGVDARSDIYALGALLYEILTGTPPFGKAQLKGRSDAEKLAMIRDIDPPLPSVRVAGRLKKRLTTAGASTGSSTHIVKALRGDIDWVVMKALEKEPTRRYDTARQMADDLNRYLNNEPVLASPAGGWYRARKFARRYRGVVAAAAVVAFAFIGAVTASGLFYVHADSDRKAAAAAFYRSEREAAARRAAQRELDSTLSFAVHDLYRQLNNSNDLEVLTEVAGQATRYFAAQLETDSVMALDLPIRRSALQNCSDILRSAGDQATAEMALKSAMSIAFDDSERNAILLDLADLYLEFNADAAAKQAIDQAHAFYSGQHESPASAAGMARVFALISRLHEGQSRWADAIDAARKEGAWREKTSNVSAEERIQTLTRLARFLSANGSNDEAIATAEQAISFLVADAAPDMLALARLHRFVGEAQRRLSPAAPEATADHWSEAFKVLSSMMDPPDAWRIERAGIAEDLAALCAFQADFSAAVTRQMAALADWTELHRRARSDQGYAESLARAHFDMGRYKKTLALPFREHWRAGLELVDAFHTGSSESWSELRKELERLKGEWIAAP
ncbi:MAG: protein kinase [Verrucomicrobiales bacterium]